MYGSLAPPPPTSKQAPLPCLCRYLLSIHLIVSHTRARARFDDAHVRCRCRCCCKPRPPITLLPRLTLWDRPADMSSAVCPAHSCARTHRRAAPRHAVPCDDAVACPAGPSHCACVPHAFSPLCPWRCLPAQCYYNYACVQCARTAHPVHEHNTLRV